MLNNIKSILDLIKWYFRTEKLRIKGNFLFDKTLIISELNTSLATIKVNAIYASCLKKKGYKAFIIFKSKQFLYEQYYRCVGVYSFIYLDTRPTSEKSNMVNKILKQSNSSENFLKFNLNGINIGKWIASRIVREQKVGEFEIEKFDKSKLIRYISESVNALYTIKTILDSKKNCSIIFNERGYSPCGEIFEYCLKNKVNTVQWFGSPLDNHHSYKRYIESNKDYHPLSLSNKSFKYLLNHKRANFFEKQVLSHLEKQYKEKKWFNRQNLEKKKKIYSKNEIVKKLNLNPKKKTAVIFSHIMYDATFFYGESIFKNYKLWLKETLKLAEKNENINWLLKIHPANKWRNEIEQNDHKTLEEDLVDDLYKKLPKNMFVLKPDSDISTYSLFSFIDYGLTVRGTVGCELSCFGIPVFTAGTGRYSHQGFTIDSENKKSYESKIKNIHKYSKLSRERTKKARIFTYGSLMARSIPMDGINIKYNLNTFLSSYHTDVKFEKISIDKLIKKLDINLFVDWFDNNELKESDRDLMYVKKSK